MNLIRSKKSEFVPVSFRSLVDQFFDDEIGLSSRSNYLPAVDILETEKAFEIQVSAPGMKKEDFQLDLNDQYLTISGERKFTRDEKVQKYHRQEMSFGAFTRTFHLPENVAASKIEASYKDGILTVIVPKDEHKTLRTSIKVS